MAGDAQCELDIAAIDSGLNEDNNDTHRSDVVTTVQETGLGN